jgi:hypothetical protein
MSMRSIAAIGAEFSLTKVETPRDLVLAELAAATGDHELTIALKAAATRITSEAQTRAAALREQARRRRSEAAEAFTSVAQLLETAEADSRLALLALHEVTDEALRRHLTEIAVQGEARVREGLEWLDRARVQVEAASKESQELEFEAEAIATSAHSRPEVAAWRQMTEPFVDRINQATSTRAVGEILKDAERQGLADERVVEAGACRGRQLNELARRTRETVKLWSRYAPGGDGMYPDLTQRESTVLAAVGPGTIFEVRGDGQKLAVHTSEDGLVWTGRKAGGPFRSRSALLRRIPKRAATPCAAAS